jgi:peptidoglycan/xylan/chitin deacetylase (PgdA/CDA1 family)
LNARMALRRTLRAASGRLFHGGAVMHGPARPEVALTFDDGPTAEFTPAILDILASRKSRATFFMLGTSIEARPELARRVAEEQEIGCHSYAHARDTVTNLDRFSADTERALKTFDEIVGRRPRFYRFPWGNRGRIAPRDVERLFGMTCIHWSGGGFDEREKTDGIVENVKNGVEPGAILLLHDGAAPGSVYAGSREPTVRALPRILDAIAAAGFVTRTVGELCAEAGLR